MQYMQQVQAAGLESDDPLASYMLQAGARICRTLGQDFLPYLPLVMPPLLAAAQLKPDLMVKDSEEVDLEDDDEEDDDDEEVRWCRDSAGACSALGHAHRPLPPACLTPSRNFPHAGHRDLLRGRQARVAAHQRARGEGNRFGAGWDVMGRPGRTVGLAGSSLNLGLG